MRVQSRAAGHVIPVSPSLVRILGRDHLAALYLRQLCYYDAHLPKDSEGYFARSVPAIERDTVLTRRQQDRVRGKLVELGWVAVRQSFCGHEFKLLRWDWI